MIAGQLTAGAAENKRFAGTGFEGPVAIASGNGLAATEKAMALLRQGSDTLDAAVAGVNLVEEDPEDVTVGYGGLPNEEGVVQLDASVMHGPTHGAAGVGALEGIVHPSRVAQKIMEYTDHVYLMGAGALKFALAMGFKQQNLLTESSRETWLKWKRSLNENDDWIDPADRLPSTLSENHRQKIDHFVRHHGTINCCVRNADGDLSGVTTTSGLAYKIPGRVGDSPIIGAGLYVDNNVGACGSTGRGEAVIKICASFLGVEFMRQGLSPEEAGLRVLKRIAENTTEPYLLDEMGRPRFNVNFYLLNKRGEFAGVTLWNGKQFAVHDGKENRLVSSAFLYAR